MHNKNSVRVKILIAALSASLLVGCIGAHTQESTGQYIDSSVITTKVKSKLLADKSIRSFPITVNTYKSTVQLSGFVDTPKQKYRAEQIAKSVEGVTNVDDALIVKSR